MTSDRALRLEYPPRGMGTAYRGRFAPSPTGDLHLGSLVAAVGSYLDARTAAGEWLVRIDDLDTPRVVPGSADRILRALDTFGFEWDGEILYQSTRFEAYGQAVAKLLKDGFAFHCSCSRREVQAAQRSNPDSGDEPRYEGWCRNGPMKSGPLAVRFRVPHEAIDFTDRIQGPVATDLGKDIGDFVIQRRDGLFAYQLAVVLDDADQAITHVVRGADLLSSTPRQIALQRALGLPRPEYAHLPVVTDNNEIKLSKSAGMGALDLRDPLKELWRALRFLRLSPPLELRLSGLPALWDWAKGSWQVHSLRGLRNDRAEAL